MEKNGTWGVSHTRVPTKSRPGLIAITAGFYEDPSAILTMFEENLVEYDHIFNHTRWIFYHGTRYFPTMLNNKKGRWYTSFYSSSFWRVRMSTNASKIDEFLFNSMKQMFVNATLNATLNSMLREDQIIFYMHLSACDLASHIDSPMAQRTTDVINLFDGGIKELVNTFNKFYKDDCTAYILTADHGMTDWGSHGSGSGNETETPLLAWGAGVAGPYTDRQGNKAGRVNQTEVSTLWRADNMTRYDVKQADIVTLMATLLGVPIPKQSIGVLPQSYLSLSPRHMALANAQNAFQLMEQCERKRQLTQISRLKFLYPQREGNFDPRLGMLYRREMDHLIQSGNYSEAIVLGNEISKESLSTMEYYESYHRMFLLTSIAIAFVGWSALLATAILKILHLQTTDSPSSPTLFGFACEDPPNNSAVVHLEDSKQRDSGTAVRDFCESLTVWETGSNSRQVLEDTSLYYLLCDSICGVVCFLTVIIVILSNWPCSHYAYLLLPTLIWWATLRQRLVWVEFFAKLSNRQISMMLLVILLHAVLVVILILAFYQPWTLSISMTIVCLWPLVTPRLHSAPRSLLATWFLTGCIVAAFPLVRVIGRPPNIDLVVLSGFLWALAGYVFMCHFNMSPRYAQFTTLQIALILLAVWNASAVSEASSSKTNPLPFYNQSLAWILLVLGLTMPLLGSDSVVGRLLNINLSLVLPFLLLSAVYEALFLVALALHLATWVALEVYLYQPASFYSIKEFKFEQLRDTMAPYTFITPTQIRRSLMVLFYVELSFFGSGNVASITSWDAKWLRCFFLEYSLLPMTCLVVLKTLIGFTMVISAFFAINLMTKAPTEKLLLCMLSVTNVMGLYFIMVVNNNGRWDQMSSSLSYHTILHSMQLFMVVLYVVVRIYSTGSLWPPIDANAAKIKEWQRKKYVKTLST